MLINDRKISLTGRVSYVGGKQDVHLWLKVNKTQRKYQVNFMGAMLKGSVTTRIAWVWKNDITPEDFRPGVRTKESGGRVTRHHVALGSTLDFQGWEG